MLKFIPCTELLCFLMIRFWSGISGKNTTQMICIPLYYMIVDCPPVGDSGLDHLVNVGNDRSVIFKITDRAILHGYANILFLTSF